LQHFKATELIIAIFYLYKDMDVKCYNKLFLIGKV